MTTLLEKVQDQKDTKPRPKANIAVNELLLARVAKGTICDPMVVKLYTINAHSGRIARVEEFSSWGTTTKEAGNRTNHIIADVVSIGSYSVGDFIPLGGFNNIN